LEYVKLQRTNDPNKCRRAVERTEHLDDPLLRHLLKGFFQLLRLHRITQLDATQYLGRKVGNAEKGDILTFSQRVTDPERAVIGNTDNIPGIGFLSERAVLGE